MTKRVKKRSVKVRNPVAKDLRDPVFHLRLKPSKKLYLRKPKHRGRSDADLGQTLTSGASVAFGSSVDFGAGIARNRALTFELSPTF